MFVLVFFCRQGLSWNSLCRLGCPPTQRELSASASWKACDTTAQLLLEFFIGLRWFQDKGNVFQCFAKFYCNPDLALNSYHSGFHPDIICHILLDPCSFLKLVSAWSTSNPQNSVFLPLFLWSRIDRLSVSRNSRLLNLYSWDLRNSDAVFLVLIHPFLRYQLYSP